MEANRIRARWTYAEYARLPESGGTRYEVIGDELAVTPSPSIRHQRIVSELVMRMRSFAVEHALGRSSSALWTSSSERGTTSNPTCSSFGRTTSIW